MEILLNDINNIENKFRKLNYEDWFKIMNTNLNIGIVIARTMDKVLRGIVYNDIVTIYFECKNKTQLYRHPEINLEDLRYYLEFLLKQDSIWYMEYILLLMLKGLRINDVLIFENGQKGLILSPKDDYRGGLHYKLIKKNGETGVKELALYAGKKYRIERS